MRIHHLNCGTMRPFGGRLIDGTGGPLHRAEMVCHCLLIEHDSGLVLVDTGMGEQGVRRPAEWLGKPFLRLTNPVNAAAETAVRQVEKLGYRAEDVRDIVLTHLDLDHAGGLADFPHATVHVYAEELRSLTSPRDFRERTRYRPIQFEHGPKWESYGDFGEDWFGFDAVRDLKGLPPEILIVPLAGHTRGHAGVAVDSGDGWLLNAGDSYFFHGQMDPVRPHRPVGLAAFETFVQTVRGPRLENQRRLAELVRDHRDEVTVFSAHSPVELRALRRVAPSSTS
ncbi:MBL fold metallo-hydrolase [Amycolatopsis anabasis]|uniref:MBL fold metallo-hydrolase n=1 Tax=Amycolatopsis anabasis TaxID=1840409 RepID=UPI00131B75FA|nr:MBL fold metallo-hydrolase [Amycolatopsis anabasis]